MEVDSLITYMNNLKLFDHYSEILKALAHPVRLCIAKGLLESPKSNVSKMQDCLQIPQSTLSQHLSKLKNAGVVTNERRGTEMIYRISNVKAERIIKFLFEENSLEEEK